MESLPQDQAAQLLPNFCSGPAIVSVVLITQLVAILIMFVIQPVGAFFWERFLMLSLYLHWIGLCGAAVLCQARDWLSRMPTGFVLAASYVLLLGMTALLAEVAWMLIRALRWQIMLGAPTRSGFVVGSLGVAAIVAAFVLRYFWVQHQWRCQIRAQAESRYSALQARIRPHFLFNTLNSLSALIRRDPVTAEGMVDDLADLFRVSLEKRHRLVPLREEMETTQAYLNIERVRAGDKLVVDWDVPQSLLETPVPVFSLQPLVENAVHHGVMQRDDGGTVSIRAELRTGASGGETVVVTVVNPVPDIPAPSKGTQLALSNLTERLRIAYHGHARLEAVLSDGQFRAAMHVPVVRDARDKGVA